jgi:hypothetical protein
LLRFSEGRASFLGVFPKLNLPHPTAQDKIALAGIATPFAQLAIFAGFHGISASSFIFFAELNSDITDRNPCFPFSFDR